MHYKILYKYDDYPNWVKYTKEEDRGKAWERFHHCCEVHAQAEVKLIKEEVLEQAKPSIIR